MKSSLVFVCFFVIFRKSQKKTSATNIAVDADYSSSCKTPLSSRQVLVTETSVAMEEED